ncbi:hypothetical protein MYE70_10735 [Marinobacter alexandrii]|uniref:hypothetical protein n=1 Tax=Marinobacter alexandrii TaxID=2570351 RepID=UPI001FFFDAD5|nr:hypothetical protein [Marinobacter alexandrii]MCK2149542.1 hypothetical protein [Marinobacter alexandrii]
MTKRLPQLEPSADIADSDLLLQSDSSNDDERKLTFSEARAYFSVQSVQRVASRAEMKAVNAAAGYQFSLDEGGRSGDFVVRDSAGAGFLIIKSVTSSSVDATSDTITATAHGLVNGDGVKPTTSVNGLTDGQLYWVVGATANTFQLSLTYGGAAVDLTGATNLTVDHLLDPMEGVFVLLDNGNYAERTGMANPRESARGEWFAAAPDLTLDSSPSIISALALADRVAIGGGGYRCDNMIEIAANKALILESGTTLKRTADTANTDPVVWIKGSQATFRGEGQSSGRVQTENRAPSGIVRLGQRDMTASIDNISYCTLKDIFIIGSLNYGQTTGSPDVGLHLPSPQIGGLVNYFHNISGIRILDVNIGVWLLGWANALTISGIQGQRIGNTTLPGGREVRCMFRVSGALDNMISSSFFTQSPDSTGMYYEDYDNTANGGVIHTPGENSFMGLTFEQGGAAANGLYATVSGSNSYFQITNNVAGGNIFPSDFLEKNILFARGTTMNTLAEAGASQTQFITKDQNSASDTAYASGLAFSSLLENETYDIGTIGLTTTDECLVEVNMKLRTGTSLSGGAFKLIARLSRDGASNYTLTVLEYKASGRGDLAGIQGNTLVFKNYNNGTATSNGVIEGTIEVYGADTLTIPLSLTVSGSAGTPLVRT